MLDYAWSMPAEVEGGQPWQLEFVVEQGAQLAWQPVVVFVEWGGGETVLGA